MEKVQERIRQLKARQLELEALMPTLDFVNNKISDAYYLHGAAAAKAIADHYRPQLLEREGWREEYNANETELASLRAQLGEEVEQTEIMED